MPDQDPALSPAQDQEVRRLLADARHDEPMPGDIAARLERVLAQLAAGDPQHDPDSVVELASRRRRRVASLLVAAAAVVAVGVGLGQVVGTGGDDSGADTASSDRVQSELPEPAEGAAGAGAENALPGQTLLDSSVVADLSYAAAGPITIRSTHFATDVKRARRAASAVRANAAQAEPAPNDDQSAQAEPVFECMSADFGNGWLLAVLYDGGPAVLALRRAVGDTQIADLVQCGSGEILRSITLSNP